MTLAHVLPPPGNHLVFLWPASAVAGAGVLIAFAARSRARRWLGALAAGVGLAATAVVYVVEPASPGPPPYAIRLAVATAAGDTAVDICPVAADGLPSVPGPNHLIDVFVDGRTAAEAASSAFLLRLPAGSHTFTAELVKANHVEFTPPAITPAVTATEPPGPGVAVPQVAC